MSVSPANMNPFPGLRPFTQEEDYLFFGREEQTIELLQRLAGNRFVAVVGTSGSGKSSLVRCGLLSELLGGKMLQAGAAWEIAVTHPGGNPLALLTDALIEADLYDPEEEHVRENVLATLSRSHFGLVEAIKQSDLPDDTNFLLVVDQFEEIFRFHEAGQTQQEAANEFVSMLLEAVAQTEVPIYVVLTMRSDFIGECGQFEGLAEMVNRGEFLIPRLSREQYKRVIEGPIKVAGGQITPRLLQRLLNDLGQQADQLPCLQHALMRTWELWAENGDAEALDLDDYQRVGRMAEALSLHADEIYASLQTDRQRRLCEGMFQALTVQETENRGIRRPQRLGRLCQILEVEADELIPIIDAYRQPGVTFLMPPSDVDLNQQTIIDISHESLMRVWTRLRHWVEEEAQAAGIYLRLSESALLHEQGKAGLYRDPELGIALAWRETEHPNAAWAERYKPGFDVAMAFLDASQQAALAEEQEQEAARQRELEQAQKLAEAERQRAADQARSAVRLRRLVRGLGLVAMVAITATVFAWLASEEAKRNADTALQAQQDTQNALTEVEKQKEEVEKQKEQAEAAEQVAKDNAAEAERQKATAEAAEDEARRAEQRSREFRYATDMQLAAVLVNDESANAGQILASLANHDPEQNSDLDGKDDLRGFEWYYLKRLVEDRAAVFDGYEEDVVEAALNSKGELVTLDADARLQHWDPQTRQETRPAIELKKPGQVTSQTISRDGTLVALGIGNSVSVFDATTGREIGRTIPTRALTGLLFSPDGKMLITVDAGIGWWDASTGSPIARQEFGLATGYYKGRNVLSVSADGLTLAVGGQGSYGGYFSVFRMDPESHDITRLLNTVGNQGTKRALAISPDGKTVAISLYFAGGLYLFDANTGKQTAFHPSAHRSSISAIEFNASGTRLVTAAMDGSVKVWHDVTDLETSETTALVGHAAQVDLAVFAAGGSRVITAGKDRSVRLWNLDRDSSSLHETISGTIGNRARYSPDGTLMAISGETRLTVRDADTGQVIAALPERDDAFGSDSVAFSPDNRLLAAGFGGANNVSFIELWDIDRRERLATLPGATDIPGFTTSATSGLVPGLTFSPDGRHLVAGFGSLNLLSRGDAGSHPLLVYDVASRRIIRRLEGPRNDGISVAFSRDGSRLASACYDGTARVWDTTTWRELHVLQNPDTASSRGNRRVHDVAFSPDGKRLAMASAESNVIIWDVDSGEHLQTLRGHSNEVWSVAFSPSGRTLASGSWDGTVRLWNTATWRELVRLAPREGFDARSLEFSPDGNRLVAADSEGTIVWSVDAGTADVGPSPTELKTWLESGLDFQNRIRLLSENLHLHESLEQLTQQDSDDTLLQAALAAAKANWHASRDEWALAAEQFDRLKSAGPVPTGRRDDESKSTGGDRPYVDWLRTPGLLRVATALLHQDRAADATALLTGGEERRSDDGNATRSTTLGVTYEIGEYPLTLSHVYRGSPAWQAGLRTGDIILKFNDVEMTQDSYADFGKQVQAGTVSLTVQRPRQEQQLTVDVAQASHIQDDLTVELIENLLALVDQKLAASANDPGLLELRAEIAGQSSGHHKQVADYSAAIEALENQEPEPNADLRRLYARRGNARLALNQWQLAYDDYSKAITDETTDEDLLASRASAQAQVLVADRLKSLDNVWFDDAPPAGTTLGGETPWEIVGRPDHPVFSGEKSFRRQAKETSQHFFTEAKPGLKIGSGGVLFAYVYLDPKDPPRTVMLQFNDGNWEHRAYWGEDLLTWGNPDISRVGMGPLPKTGEWVRLEVPVEKVSLKPGTELNGWAFTQFDGICYWDRAGIAESLGAFESPWQKLAAAYRVVDDQQAIDQLVSQRPKMAGAIGGLFTQDGNQDWRRAVEIYSKGITPETTDEELLGKRAKAYEELQDWEAAAADWTRAAGDRPQGAPLLTDFADRLLEAGQNELASTQRQRAREILEAALKADPGDDPAIDALATLLLDMSEPVTEWAVLKPTELQTSGGTALALADDGSLTLQRKPHVFTLADPNNSLQAIRIETSTDAASSEGEAPAFTEYRILSTDLPAEGFRGRYVRIDLPGDNKQFPRHSKDGDGKTLTLAEVQVFREAENIAQSGQARQSSTAWDGVAQRAIDGNTDGNYQGAQTSTHTADTDVAPWWELDFGSEQSFDRLVLWNRTDGEFPQRLRNYRVRILDAERQLLYERFVEGAPNPSAEIAREIQLAKIQSDAADGVAQWQVSGDGGPGLRFRISRELTWNVIEPATLTAAEGTQITPGDDGSFAAKAEDSGELVLPQLPDGTKAVRFETASGSGQVSGTATAFKDYRVEAIDAPRSESGALQGRYVRIDLPGPNEQFPRRPGDALLKSLNLAELQVFNGDENVALGKSARQSSINRSQEAGGFKADFAVDGRTEVGPTIDLKNNPFAETHYNDPAPWWEVDLGDEQRIDRIVVWNRTGSGGVPERMNHFRIRVLDADRDVVLEQVVDEAPRPSREIDCHSWLVAGKADADAGPSRWSLPLSPKSGIGSQQQMRIATSDFIPSVVDQQAATDREWVVLEPATITPASGTTLTAQEDGSYVVHSTDDSLPLPMLAGTAKAIRVETASASGSDKASASAFKDYRIETIGAPRSETGALKGRYVRLDLPGDNSQFPRHPQDGEKKVINLAELQVFQGQENIALRKNARQSSDADSARKAEWAVDGDNEADGSGNANINPFAHTSGSDPWWEVDLGSMHEIDRIVIWNRTGGDLPLRMNHFRVRILDASRNMVFEQVIDEAPKPSREIDCGSMFAAKTSISDGALRTSLRLNRRLGIDPGVPLRVTATSSDFSLEREEAIAAARKIPQSVTRLASAWDLNGASIASADWFRRALDEADNDNQRKPILTHLQDHPEPLAELLRQSPDDIDLQLALARSHVKDGQEQLTQQERQAALTEFQAARDLFTKLLGEHPQPAWTVLEPSELNSTAGATLTVQPDGSVFVSGDLQAKDTFIFDVSNLPAGTTAIRLEALRDDRLPQRGPGTHSGGNFVLSEFKVLRGNEGDHESAASVPLKAAFASFEERPATDSLSPGEAGWSVGGGGAGKDQTAVFQAVDSESLTDLQAIRIVLDFYHESNDDKPALLGRFRLSATSEPIDDNSIRLMDLKDAELAALDVSMGQSFAQQDGPEEAATAFARALDRVEEDDQRKELIEQFQEQLAALTILAEQRPQDSALQLALAKSLAASGKTALNEKRDTEALRQLAQAQELFAKLASEHREPEWTLFVPTEMISKGGAELSLEPDGSILASGENPTQDTYELSAETHLETISAMRLETLPDSRLPQGGSGRSDIGNFGLNELRVFAVDDSGIRTTVPVAESSSSSTNKNSIRGAFDGSGSTWWAVWPSQNQPQWAQFTFHQPVSSALSHRLVIEIDSGENSGALGRFRLSVTSDPNAIEAARFQQELKASGLQELQLALGNAHGRQGRVDESAAAFGAAFDLAVDREGRTKIVEAAAAYEGVLARLTELRPDDASYQDALARHQQTTGDFPAARTTAATARTLYEQQLAAEPNNSKLAKELADLLLEVSPVDWTILKPEKMKSAGGADLKLLADGSVLASGTNPPNDIYTLSLQPKSATVRAIRLETLPDEHMPNGGSGRNPGNAGDAGNFALTGVNFRLESDESNETPESIPLQSVHLDFSDGNSGGATDGGAALLDSSDETYWSVYPAQTKPHVATFELTSPVEVSTSDRLIVELRFQHPGWKQRGLGRFRLSVTDEAIQPARLAEKVTNSSLQLGLAYRALGDADKAAPMFVRSIELAATDQAKAEVAQEAAAFDDIFAQLLERFPDDKSLRLGQAKYLASKHLEEQQFQAAVDVLSGVLAESPDDIDLLNQRAGAYMKLADWTAADADYSRVINLEADDGKRRAAERSRAECLMRMGLFQAGADACLEELLLRSNGWDGMRYASASALLTRDAGVARLAANRLYKAHENNNDVNAFWSQLLVRLHTAVPGLVTSNNQQRLLDAAKTAGGNWTAPLTAAIHFRLGDLDKAQPLLETSRNDSEFQALAALLLYEQGDAVRAAEFLSRAESWLTQQSERDPQSVIPAHVNWGHWAINRSVWREATRKLIGPRIVELDSEVYGGLSLEIVNASYGVAGLQEDVTDTLREYFSENGTLSWNLVGYRAVFGDPAPNKYKDLTVKFRLNDVEGEQVLPEDSPIDFIALANRVLKQGPTNSPALLERARLLADAGLHEEALDDLERLVALNVDSPEAHALHGRVLVELRRDEEALPHLSQAIAAGSQDVGVFAARGAILLKQQKIDEARADLEKSLELQPTELAARSLADLLLAEAENATNWTVLTPTEMKSEGGADLKLLADGSVLASGTNPHRDVYTLICRPPMNDIASIRLEALPDPSLPNSGPGRAENGNFYLNELRVVADGVSVTLTDVAVAYDEFGNSRTIIDGQIDGSGAWANAGNARGQKNVAIVSAQLHRSADQELRIELHCPTPVEVTQHTLGRFRFSATDDPEVFAREKLRLKALKSGNPWLRLAHARLLHGDVLQAADSFALAFQRAVDDDQRAVIFEQVTGHEDVFVGFSTRIEQVPQFHLFNGNRFAAKGQWAEADAAYRRAVELDANAVTNWIQTGYWKVEGYPFGLETTQPPETTPDPFVAVARGGNATETPWQAVTPETGGRFNFGTERACHYVLTRLWSPIERRIAVQMGDDDQVRLFVNDQLLFQSQSSQNGVSGIEHEISATLQPGWNTVLIKLQNYTSACDLILRLSNNEQDLIAARLGSAAWEAEQLTTAGNTDEAIRVLHDAIDEQSEDDTLFARRAQTFQRLKLWEQAVADWDHADRINPQGRVDSLYLEHQATAFGVLKQHDQELAAWNTLLERHEQGVYSGIANYFHAGRGSTYRSMRQWEKADADYDRAVVLSPTNQEPDFILTRARHFALQGRWREAADDFAAAAAHTSPTNYIRNSWGFSRELALACLMANDTDGYRQAAAQMDTRIGENISRDQSHWLLWVFTASPEMVNDATLARLTAATKVSNDYHRNRNAAALLFRTGQFDESIQLFEQHTGGAEYQYLAAMAHFRSGNTELADRLLAQANTWLHQQSGDLPVQYLPENQSQNNWIVYLNLKREAEALIVEPPLADRDQAIAADPGNIELLLDRIQQNEHWGRVAEVRADLDNVAAATTDNVATIARRATLFSHHGRLDAARADYAKLTTLDPQNALWPERAAHLTPETIALWHFDSGTEGWLPIARCELAAADGILTTNSTGGDPHFGTRITAREGWFVLTVRARSSQRLPSQFYWSTTTTGAGATQIREFDVAAIGEDWHNYTFYFRTNADLTEVRLDPGSKAGEQADFDWIRLERVEEESLRTIAAEVVQNAERGEASDDDLTRLAQLLEALDGESGRKRFRDVLTAAIEVYSDNQPLRAARGRLFAANQNWLAALEDFNLAITPETTDAALIATRANAHKELKQWEEAVADWTQALKLQPDDLGWLNERAAALAYQLRRHEEALADWNRLVELDPQNAWRLMSRYGTYNALGQHENAIADLNHAVEISGPGDLYRSLQLRGEWLARHGEWDQAARDLNGAVAGNVGGWAAFEVYRAHALLRLMVDDVAGWQAGASKLEESLANDSQPDRKRWLLCVAVAGPSNLSQQDFDRLQGIVDGQLSPNDAAWQTRLRAALLYRTGKFQEAADLFDKNPRGPLWPALNFMAAMAHHRLGHQEQARKLFDETNEWVKQQEEKEEGPAVPNGHNWQDWAIYKSLQREAIHEFAGPRLSELDAALQADPGNASLLAERALVFARVGQFDQALADLNQSIADNADSVELLGARGRVLARLERPEEALADLARAVELKSSDDQVYAARGAILFEQGQSEAAEADLKKSLALKPNEEAARALADLLLDQAEKSVEWTMLRPSVARSEGGATLTAQEDGSILASGEHPDRDVYVLDVPVNVEGITGIALELIPDQSLPRGSIGRGADGQAMITELEIERSDDSGNLQTVRLSGATADFEPTNQWGEWTAARVIDGEDGPRAWGVSPRQNERHLLVVKTAERVADGTTALRIVIRQSHFNDAHPQGLLLGRFRLFATNRPDALELETRRFAALRMENTAARLATAFELLGREAEFNQMVEASPEAMRAVADGWFDEGEWERALTLYDRLITPETTDTGLLVKRGEAYFAAKQPELARADWRRAAELVPTLAQTQFDRLKRAERWSEATEFGLLLIEQKPEDSMQWVQIAPIVSLAADHGSYVAFCTQVLKQPADTAVLADRAIKACLLKSETVDIPEHLSDALARDLDDGTAPDWLLPHAWGTRALLAYRSGDAQSGVKYANEANRHEPNDFAHALNLTVLALSQHQLQNSDEAKAALAAASRLIASLKEDPGKRSNHDLLIAEILLREADRKLNDSSESLK